MVQPQGGGWEIMWAFTQQIQGKKKPFFSLQSGNDSIPLHFRNHPSIYPSYNQPPMGPPPLQSGMRGGGGGGGGGGVYPAPGPYQHQQQHKAPMAVYYQNHQPPPPPHQQQMHQQQYQPQPHQGPPAYNYGGYYCPA